MEAGLEVAEDVRPIIFDCSQSKTTEITIARGAPGMNLTSAC